MAMLSFNARVDLAVTHVRADFPGAELLEADGRASSGLIDHPSAIDQLRLAFRSGRTTLIVEETGYGLFGAPEVVPLHRDDPGVAWPPDMDLPEADRLKDQSGHIDPYARVSLRVPHGATWGHPAFVFAGNPACPEVWVDTVTGVVRTRG